MRFVIQHHVHWSNDVLGWERRLQILEIQGERIMATQAEAAAQLTAVNERLAKIGGETQALTEKIVELQAVLADQNQVSPELQAAIDAVVARAESVDSLVPDAEPVVE